jgi:hypothetical protein
MKDTSLNAVERNKKIQDIMAGRVELPKVSEKKDHQVENATSNAAEAELTGGEAMLTDMPDENDVALAKRKVVQNVMKDTSLNAIERNKMIQDIMAGRVELPKLISKRKPSDPINATISVPTKTSDAETHKKENGKAQEPPSRRREKKSTKKSDHTNGVAKTDAPPVSKDDKLSPKSPHNIAHTSNSTMETFDSSGDEQKEAESSNTSHQQTINRSCSLLEIDHSIDLASAEEERAQFQEALSIAASSENQSPDEKALLTAMTFALYDLDCHWKFDSFDLSRQTRSTKSISLQSTLGARERIAPWSKYIDTNSESIWDRILDNVSPMARQGPPKPKRGLRKLSSQVLLDDSFNSVEESYRSMVDSIMDSFDNVNKSVEESYRSMGSIDGNRGPKNASDLLTQASFNLKKSAVIEKISQDLLLEPPSEEEDEVDAAETIIRFQRWFKSILKLDPRWQIRKFFDDASVTFDNAEIFTVWRSTSFDAVAKMMRGEGVGKGLDIKGKSALCGDLSGVCVAFHFVFIYLYCHQDPC